MRFAKQEKKKATKRDFIATVTQNMGLRVVLLTFDGVYVWFGLGKDFFSPKLWRKNFSPTFNGVRYFFQRYRPCEIFFSVQDIFFPTLFPCKIFFFNQNQSAGYFFFPKSPITSHRSQMVGPWAVMSCPCPKDTHWQYIWSCHEMSSNWEQEN